MTFYWIEETRLIAMQHANNWRCSFPHTVSFFPTLIGNDHISYCNNVVVVSKSKSHCIMGEFQRDLLSFAVHFLLCCDVVIFTFYNHCFSKLQYKLQCIFFLWHFTDFILLFYLHKITFNVRLSWHNTRRSDTLHDYSLNRTYNF